MKLRDKVKTAISLFGQQRSQHFICVALQFCSLDRINPFGTIRKQNLQTLKACFACESTNWTNAIKLWMLFRMWQCYSYVKHKVCFKSVISVIQT